jgi:hypothetical protein
MNLESDSSSRSERTCFTARDKISVKTRKNEKKMIVRARDEDHKRKREEGRESEERINPFRKSKKVERSRVKKAMDKEMKKMLEKIMEDVGEIKEENRKMSRELE